jgi:hypothetical protein
MEGDLGFDPILLFHHILPMWKLEKETKKI